MDNERLKEIVEENHKAWKELYRPVTSALTDEVLIARYCIEYYMGFDDIEMEVLEEELLARKFEIPEGYDWRKQRDLEN